MVKMNVSILHDAFSHKVKADTLVAAVQPMRVPGPCMLLKSICFALALIFAYSRFCITVVQRPLHLFH